MNTLAEFQQHFAAALLHPEADEGPYGTGLRVYRNTVCKGLIDVLRANYPTVEKLVGAQWFDSAALNFARANLPRQPSLALYGAEFGDFLADAESLTQFLYVAHVARLDRLWSEAHFAPDGAVLSAAELRDVALPMLELQLHPAARFACVPHSAASIWLQQRTAAATTLEVRDEIEHLLFTRPDGEVITTSLDAAAHLFLTAIETGESLGNSATEVLAAHPQAQVAPIFAQLLDVGAFLAKPRLTTTLEHA